jgi:uncharacterized UPF0160 family protein
MKGPDQQKLDREFIESQKKSYEEKLWEEYFHQLPKHDDGTVTINDLRPLRDLEDLNDLMLPLNTRRPK